MRGPARSLYRGIALIGIFTFPCAAYAHEKWFADATAYPTQWAQPFRFPQIIGVSLALAATMVLAIVWRRNGRRALLPGPEALGATPEGRARFYALVPLILGTNQECRCRAGDHGTVVLAKQPTDRAVVVPGWASCRSESL